MVLPLIPLASAAIGAGGSIFAGLMGNKAQQQADMMNYQVALMNYYQREREREQAIQEAHRQERDTKLGTTDAAGNRTYFVPGQGWVTELSPQQKILQELYREEEMNQLGQDIPAKRQQMFANIARQRGEGGYASGIMEAMQRLQRENPEAIINRRNQASTEGITKGMDTALQAAMQNAVRTGSSNAGKIASSIGRERSDALRTAFMQNMEGARGESENAYSTKLGNMSNLYNMFASRASAMPDAPYNPRNVEGVANEQLAGGRAAGASAGGNLLNAFGKQGGVFEYKQEPQYGIANTIQTATNALTGAFERNRAYGDYGNASSAYNDYSQPQSKYMDYYRSNVGPW